MTTLHDRLADLADELDVARAGPPDLWPRGRRYGRRRAAGVVATTLVVALVAALGAAGLAARSTRPVEPVAPEGRTVLPDRFFVPDGRLPTASHGTGPLVAVIPAEHFSWTGFGRPGLVGVSAVDQKYAFLDLPGWTGEAGTGESWSLSTNGRWVAYWYGDRKPVGSEYPADGIALLDTATGEVRRHELKSKLGVQAHEVAWTGDTLWFTKWDYRSIDEDGSSGRLVASYAWDPDDDGPHEVDDPRQLLLDPMGPALEEGFLARARGDRWFVVSGEADLTAERSARLQTQSSGDAAALSPNGRTIAVTEVQNSGSQARILTGTVAGDDTHVTYLRADLGAHPNLLGWLDNDSLIVVVSRDDDRRLVSVDVATGQTRVLSTFEQPQNEGAKLASDLLRSPVVNAVAPPDPIDPRLVASGIAALVVLLVVCLRWWRRRAQR